VQAVPDAQNLKQNVSQVQQSLQGLGSSIAPIDQQRNATLDQNLQAGGGWGNKLRNAQGSGKIAQGMRALGDKIKNIPALNKDMGLRRAMAQGMDSLNVWAQQNPNKAAALNIGSAVAGGVAGAMGAGAFQNASIPQQPGQQVTGNDSHGQYDPNQLPGTHSGSTVTGNDSHGQYDPNQLGGPTEPGAEWTKQQRQDHIQKYGGASYIQKRFGR